MSTPEFDKFDLDGLSLEDIEPQQAEKPVEPNKAESPEISLEDDLAQLEEIIEVNPVEEAPMEPPSIEAAPPPPPVETPIEAKPVQAQPVAAPPPAGNSESENLPEGKMACPKCELVQDVAEQCSGCGVYVAKAQAQTQQSKIVITSTKF